MWKKGLDTDTEFPWTYSRRSFNMLLSLTLNLGAVHTNSYFYLNCDSLGAKLFVFYWKNISIQKPTPMFQILKAVNLLTEICTMTIICLFQYGKYLAHKICGILVSWDIWNWPGPGPPKDDCCVGKGMDGMTWKVYSSSNFDDVILTRWGQWHIRRLLMLPLWFSSWVYSSGNCIFSLAGLSICDAQHVRQKALCVSHGAGCKVFMKGLSKSNVCIYILIFLWKPCDPSQIVAFSVLYLFEYGQRHGFLMLWCHVCVWRKIINHSTVSCHVWFSPNKRAGQLLKSNLKIVE